VDNLVVTYFIGPLCIVLSIGATKRNQLGLDKPLYDAVVCVPQNKKVNP